MKTLYLDCGMGAAGDMLTAALLELYPDPAGFLARLNGLGLPGVEITAHPAEKCGIHGTHVHVTVHGEEETVQDMPAVYGRPSEGIAPHKHEEHTHQADEPAPPAHEHEPHEHNHPHAAQAEQPHTHTHASQAHCHGDEPAHTHTHHAHAHTSLEDITHLLSHLQVPQKVRDDARAVYLRIAQAESRVHGCPVEQIHFHEVGSLDAVADVVAVCLLIHELAPERIVASPVHVGSGQVRCAHGVLPVPAPATADILRGVPTYGGSIQGELCTPTGAALIAHFVQQFGPQPVMCVNAVGYGMGHKDFEAANCVRALLGEQMLTQEDTVAELRCNLDDMTPEAVGFAVQRLLEGGARDVFTTPVQMKKDRPGVLLTCVCTMNQREEMTRLLFRHTTTLGVRETVCARRVLNRTVRTVETDCGPVRVKRAEGWGVVREKPEYEDMARIAREKDLSLAQVNALLAEKI